MGNHVRWHEWGPHEGDFLGWLRLRHVLARILARPELSHASVSDLDDGLGRPPSLSLCRRRCYRNVLRRMAERGLPTPDQAGGSAPRGGPSWTSVEAAWRLLPAFGDDWGALWRLWLLEQTFGPGAFSRLAVSHSFLQHDRTVLRSPLHAGRGTPPTRLDVGIDAVAAKWFHETPEGWRLNGHARDAVTLFRFVLYPSVTMPAERLGSIPPIQPDSNNPLDDNSSPKS